MKGIYIDPVNREVREVEGKIEYEDIKNWVGGYIENGGDWTATDDSVFINENGRLIEGDRPAFFVPGVTNGWLCGKALILGTNEEGENESTTLEGSDIRKKIIYAIEIGDIEGPVSLHLQTPEDAHRWNEYGKQAYGRMGGKVESALEDASKELGAPILKRTRNEGYGY